MNVSKHVLLYVLVPVCAIVIAVSFYRFMLAGDYIVEYEGECDPVTQICFVGCEDEECAEPYYYANIHKYAADVEAQCGIDFAGCEEGSVCQPGDRTCFVTYCDPATETENEPCEQIEGYMPEEPTDGEFIEAEEEEVAPEEAEETTTL